MRFSVLFLLQLTALVAAYAALWVHNPTIALCGTPCLLVGCLLYREFNKGRNTFSEIVCSSGIYALICFWVLYVLPVGALVSFSAAIGDMNPDYFIITVLVSIAGSLASIFTGCFFGIGCWCLLRLVNYRSLRETFRTPED